jgi:uncharacterized protein YjdB
MKNLYKLFGIIVLVAIIGLSFASCGDTDGGGITETNEKAVYTSVDDEGNKYELTITPKSDKAAYEPKAGDTYTLTIFYKDGTTKTSVGTVTHEVKNGSTVTATLSVSDISYTVTLLTVTDDVRVFTEIKGTIPITDGNDDEPTTIEIELTLKPQVENESKAVIGVILNKTALALDVGGSETLVATVLPTNAENKNVTWNSSNTAMAQVSNSGLVTAVAKGNAVITVTTEDGNKEAICNVSVKEVVISDIAVTGVTMNKNTLTLTVGGSETLIATVAPANATNKNVTWSSSNNAIATVSANGAVNALSAGSANIIVTTADGGFTATCAVSVTSGSTNVPVTGVTLNKITTGLLVGGTETLYATVLPSNATNKAITWSSSNTSIVTVTNGLITGIAAGTANITVTTADGNKTANCGVLVSASAVAPTGVRLNKTIIELNVGDTETLTATVLPTNATNQNVTWEITNPPDKVVATVSESGIVRAVSVGDAQIFAITSNGIKTPCAVKVRDVSVTGVTLNKSALALKTGESETLTATVLPANATNKTVKWESSAPSVATVENGLVSAVSAGSATITVETVDGKKTATCIVTVTASTISVTFSSVTANGSSSQTSTELTLTFSAPISGLSAADITLSGISGVTKGTLAGSNPYTLPISGFTAGGTLKVEVAKTGYTISGTHTVEIFVYVPVSGVTLNKHTLELDVGASETLIATVLPANATNKAVIWSSSDPEKATVSESGVVTGFDLGKTTITVKTVDGEFTDICDVTLSFITPAGLAAYLAKKSVNSTSTPYNIPLKVRNINEFEIIKSALNGALNKYVNLNLTSSTITSIPDRAFSTESWLWEGCTTLCGITLPDSVTSIGQSTFRNCSSLTSINIPNSVISIGNYAFSYSGLTSVTIEYGVISIGESAFDNCKNLNSINIPNSVTSIGIGVFRSCFSLASIIIPESITSIPNYAFFSCIHLTSITIPNSVTSIGQTAFVGDTELTSIKFAEPSKVTNIGSGAFHGCDKLNNVIIPDSVTSIGYDAFGNCLSLSSVTIGNSVTSIGDLAFKGCRSLTSVTIPDSVTSIGSGVFGLCSSLFSIIVGSGNNSYSSENGILYNKSKTTLIAYPTASGSYTIPNNVTSIGGGAFYQCTSLASVIIGNSVISIGESAFYQCILLTNLTIGNSVTSIGNEAFYDCRSLTIVTIPHSVTSIERDAFFLCDSLASVTLGNNVTSIGQGAFDRCKNLISVTFLGVIPSSGFSTTSAFLGDLRAKYYATNGGQGEYTTTAPVSTSSVWTKQ